MDFLYFTLLLSLSLLPLTSPSPRPPCATADTAAVASLFTSVTGFHPSFLPTTACTAAALTELHLPNRNLNGAVSWNSLKNLTHLHSIDLSGNSLKGSVPNWVWSLPALRRVNLSGNHFGGAVDPRLKLPISNSNIGTLDLSRNRITKLTRINGFKNLRFLGIAHNDLRVLPSGLSNLTNLEHLDVSSCNLSGKFEPISSLKSLKYLDVSMNNLSGLFPLDFPPLSGLKFLNISLNNFSGQIAYQSYLKFGKYAFLQAGKSLSPSVSGTLSNSKHPKLQNINSHKKTHKKPTKNAQKPGLETQKFKSKSKSKSKSKFKFIMTVSFSSIAAVVLFLLSLFTVKKYKKRNALKKMTKWAISKPTQIEKSGPFDFESGSGSAAAWVAEIAEPSSAAVVMFEKPLMRLTFNDLIAATCHFGSGSLVAEGRCGPVYRAVLPGDLHVAVKVMDSATEVDREEAVTWFEGMGKVKHPNLLTISGYCIAGKEKLLLYEYMPNGDLHAWLHELPHGKPNVDDWSTDTWDHPTTTSPDKLSWLMRHRIALGVARGLAFLHHAGSKPIVHGHLVPSNILLADDLEPRVADFGMCHSDMAGVGSTEADVYSFGLVLIELLTGKPGSEETVGWVRRLVKASAGEQAVDPRLRCSDDAVLEMVECLGVGYLCTAEAPNKRPTMRQVVGLLKDIGPGTS